MENIEDKPMSKEEVEENLKRIKLGMELTRSLKRLSNDSNFIQKYEEQCNIDDGLPKKTNIRLFELSLKKKSIIKIQL